MTNPTPHGQVPNKYLTVVYRDIAPGKEARELIEHPKMSASSWSHALNDRDAAIAQVSTLRTAHVQNPAEIEHDAGDVSKNGAGLNMSTQHTRIAELEAQIEALSGVQALSAAPAVPAAWKAVPVNPTPEMWKSAKTVPDPNPPYPPHYGLVWDAMLAASPTPPAEQAAPKAEPEVGNSGFDYKTAADFLNNKTVSDEAVRKFVAASRWAHDERAALSATLLAMHGVLTSREAEIALLKKALLEAEAAPQQEVQEPALFVSSKQLAALTDPDDPEGEHGRYLPARKTSQGLFTQPLYTTPQPAPAPLSEREAFEAWIEKDGGDLGTFGTPPNMHYRNSSVNNAWVAWKARAALAAQGGKDA